jgi:anthranilate/para-aminobenzoate synthase component II
MAIFIIFLCLLLVFGVITARRAKKSRSMMMNNPLFALSNRGFLGFVLGDSKNFVWSRINHLGLMTQEELDDLYKQIDLCDGFLLQGGMYSCSYEIEIAKRILELDKPLLGICAGFNNILRALGTDVLLDKTKSHDIFDKDYRHKIIIDKDSIIYDLLGKEEYEVNSIHSMIATKEIVNSVARSTSYSEEGLVESFQMDDKKFVVGIKWQPEIMHDEFVDKLFKMLVDKSSE